MKKLPIGTQDFEKLRTENCLYVDKTALLHRLITEGSVYFISRPRRFGKSLLVTTLKALFEGRRELFTGLAIDELDYDWAPHPVLHIDFSSERIKTTADLEDFISRQLLDAAGKWGIELRATSYTAQLRELLENRPVEDKAVVLIDEYDKPILDHIDDTEKAVEMRETLKGFYTTIKACDAYLRFVLLTGVTKFAKMSVFSGLNNLNDITMHSAYATLMGYTQDELERCFDEYIPRLMEKQEMNRDECLEQIRRWYNGYCFSPFAERVYNPFSTLLLFNGAEFSNFWYETGTPTFLIKLARREAFEPWKVGNVSFSLIGFSQYNVENLRTLPLLYQAGYLTISAYNKEDDVYILDYPNMEVRKAFTECLASEYSGVSQDEETEYLLQLRAALRKGDMEQFFETMSIFFANIPYDITLKNEKYYQTVFYLVFLLLGMRMEAECRTNKGRIDAVAVTTDTVFIFEFKLHGTAEEALAQIAQNEYARKYAACEKTIRAFGVAFDPETRNIGAWREGPRPSVSTSGQPGQACHLNSPTIPPAPIPRDNR
ncbi:MAG: AAA family ATPase [Spartobacteria bacterium]|nr:AAA family ATPase [Spartobacteria bacterium]